ncbi:hypothetical protein VCHA53O463_110121 [Vibrio chagasii]|nr:hypothetical protein VCHA35P150_20432 [Vibrio chagasii]CAH6905590.1 hypothetical protein VCHA56P515_100041 [Vibrio chagasii]CAH6969665.1 hypothetical protein VCHA53O463_110121 [Vibrio chagasii]CAH7386961.1 hypothetical protein VCHA53O464_20036 [Vibrio chagasii]
MKIFKRDELIEQLNSEVRRAVDWQSSQIQAQIADAYKAYYGYHKKSKAGYSNNVERVVFEGIEAVRGPIIEMFTMSNELVRFQTDDDSVDPNLMALATKEVNKVVQRVNDGYEVFRDWFLDGLLAKNGIVKSYWAEEFESEIHEFEDLTAEQVLFILSEPDIDNDTIKFRDFDGGIESLDPFGVYSGTIERVEDRSGIRVDNIAPEEFVIAERNRSLKRPEFLAHRSRYTKAELKEMFPDFKNEIEEAKSDNKAYWEEVLIARHGADSTYSIDHDSSSNDPEMQFVWLYECYITTSFVKKGRTQLYQVFTDLTTVYSIEEVEESPFHSVCPITIPHKFYGLSLADVLIDIQETKTDVVRGIVDSLKLNVKPRFQAPKGRFDVKALLSNRAGSVVEVEDGEIRPIGTPQVPQEVGMVLDLMQEGQVARTGVSKATQGLDENLLKNNVAQGTVLSVREQGETRLRQIAREYANTGVKQLFARIYRLMRDNDVKTRYYEPVDGERVPWTFDMLPERIDVQVTVALGRSAQMEEANKKLQAYNIAKENNLLIPEFERKYFKDILELMGVTDIRAYMPDQLQIEEYQEKEALRQAELQAQIPPNPVDMANAEAAKREQENKAQDLKIQEQNVLAKLAEIEVSKIELADQREKDQRLHEREMMKLNIDALDKQANIQIRAEEVKLKGEQVLENAERGRAELALKARESTERTQQDRSDDNA